MTNAITTGYVLAKSNATDAEFQSFLVREIDGDLFYYNSSVFDWCSVPKSWIGSIVWK